jgi:SAM-dependent methyltransferase
MHTSFDAWAHRYDASALQPVFRAAHHAVLNHVRQHIEPKSILDVGCGTGRLIRLAAAAFPDALIVGVDVSSGMLNRVGRERRLQAAAERLPFRDGAFDLVVSTASYRHWTDHGAALREIGRVLSPDGLLVLADLFPAQSAGLRARVTGRIRLPSAVTTTFAGTDLRVLGADSVGGFGPIPSITVVLASRTPQCERLRARPSQRARSLISRFTATVVALSKGMSS